MIPMRYNPATGKEMMIGPYYPDEYRASHGPVTWLYNPWTGEARDPRDIGSDVFGHLIRPPAEDAPAADSNDDTMPPGFYADMLAIEVSFTGAASSEFHVDVDGEAWVVTAERVGCGRCGGGRV